jgi:hypothetical protein
MQLHYYNDTVWAPPVASAHPGAWIRRLPLRRAQHVRPPPTWGTCVRSIWFKTMGLSPKTSNSFYGNGSKMGGDTSSIFMNKSCCLNHCNSPLNLRLLLRLRLLPHSWDYGSSCDTAVFRTSFYATWSVSFVEMWHRWGSPTALNTTWVSCSRRSG